MGIRQPHGEKLTWKDLGKMWFGSCGGHPWHPGAVRCVRLSSSGPALNMVSASYLTGDLESVT